jgi:hypothetical protein
MDNYLIEKIIGFVDSNTLDTLQLIYPILVTKEIKNRLTEKLNWKLKYDITRPNRRCQYCIRDGSCFDLIYKINKLQILTFIRNGEIIYSDIYINGKIS